MSQIFLFCLTIISIALISVIVILIPLWRKKTRLAFITAAIIVIAIPTTAILLYLHWGGGESLKKYYEFQNRHAAEQKVIVQNKDPRLLIERMQAILAKQPDSVQGWYLLGRLYFIQNRYKDAYNSFTKAYQLDPKKLIIQISMAESSFFANQERLTPQTKQLLYGMLQKASDQPDALNLLAMDAFHHKQFGKAIAYWQRMQTQLPADSDSARMIKQAIATAQKQMNDLKVK